MQRPWLSEARLRAHQCPWTTGSEGDDGGPCNRVYASYELFLKHILRDHVSRKAGDPGLLPCRYGSCTHRAYPDSALLKRHVRESHLETSGCNYNYSCPYVNCKHVLPSEVSLALHIERFHDEEYDQLRPLVRIRPASAGSTNRPQKPPPLPGKKVPSFHFLTQAVARPSPGASISPDRINSQIVSDLTKAELSIVRPAANPPTVTRPALPEAPSKPTSNASSSSTRRIQRARGLMGLPPGAWPGTKAAPLIPMPVKPRARYQFLADSDLRPDALSSDAMWKAPDVPEDPYVCRRRPVFAMKAPKQVRPKSTNPAALADNKSSDDRPLFVSSRARSAIASSAVGSSRKTRFAPILAETSDDESDDPLDIARPSHAQLRKGPGRPRLVRSGPGRPAKLPARPTKLPSRPRRELEVEVVIESPASSKTRAWPALPRVASSKSNGKKRMRSSSTLSEDDAVPMEENTAPATYEGLGSGHPNEASSSLSTLPKGQDGRRASPLVQRQNGKRTRTSRSPQRSPSPTLQSHTAPVVESAPPWPQPSRSQPRPPREMPLFQPSASDEDSGDDSPVRVTIPLLRTSGASMRVMSTTSASRSAEPVHGGRTNGHVPNGRRLSRSPPLRNETGSGQASGSPLREPSIPARDARSKEQDSPKDSWSGTEQGSNDARAMAKRQLQGDKMASKAQKQRLHSAVETSKHARTSFIVRSSTEESVSQDMEKSAPAKIQGLNSWYGSNETGRAALQPCYPPPTQNGRVSSSSTATAAVGKKNGDPIIDLTFSDDD